MRNAPRLLDAKGNYAAQTEYTITVTQVLKGRSGQPPAENLVVGSILTIVREGGDVDLGDEIVRSLEVNFAPFQIGDEYILFLHWNGALGKYMVQWGPDGAFRLSANTVEAMGRSPLSRKLNGSAVDGFLQALKKS